MADIPPDVSHGDLGIYDGAIPRRLDTVDCVAFARLAWMGGHDTPDDTTAAAWALFGMAECVAVQLAGQSPEMRRAFWVWVDTIRDASTRLPALELWRYVRDCERLPFTAGASSAPEPTPAPPAPPLKAEHPAASKARRLRVLKPGDPGYTKADPALL